ncbi:phosphoesterase PA-phosphatase-related protein [Natrialba hulunbeirensis JCM 10989]|uniref:Phosphoesterase PA-phosphatase-related protein n=1 Tax=Natrialba hulunbeirensis JCM 10989 TaxID=1227493 RepID=L9ZWE0_9EURY|nr:phosphatase PAP2 family protein [Natrialba hulunbeirensis]ELY89468.1 phosphoesterase PA-phosphatase-related protein [Natrialba hulunbeirensis JCM 10989]
MSRGIGEFNQIQEQIPEWAAVIIALLTQLGDIWFLALVLTVAYWIGVPNRDDIGAVAGVWLAGMGLYKGLKEIFGFPRPDEPLLDPELLPVGVQQLYEATAFASGYGFPSGHAVNTTIVFFGLAHVLTVSTRRRRFAVAAGLVATVAFSRVALGVHYLVDVVVGFAVGALLLLSVQALSNRLTDRTTVAFAAAIVFGGFFVVTSDVAMESVFILAASLGAFAGWQLIVLGRRLVAVDLPSQAARPVALHGGLAALTLAPLVGTFELFPVLSVYVAGGLAGLATALVVTIPVLRHSPHARRAGVSLAFWLRAALAGLRYLLSPRTWRRALSALSECAERVRNRVRNE